MHQSEKQEVRYLLLSIFLVSLCAITYELLIGALASYLIGNSVTQFSVTIGLFLSFMGIGSWLSRYIKDSLLVVFLNIEIILSAVGGLSLLLLYLSYTYTELYTIVYILLTALIGTFIGLEIPILTRIIKKYGSIRMVLSNVLAFDYLGGLVASILFPFILLPYFGLMKTAFLIGLLNIAVAVLMQVKFSKKLYSIKRIITTFFITALLILGFISAVSITGLFEKELYNNTIIYSKQSAIQKIVITRRRHDIRLYLDGSLQFSTVDEARYHESLVHPAALMIPRLRNVLVLGGGDGMAVRELLKYKSVKKIVLVDIDKLITDLAKDFKPLMYANDKALKDPRVEIINADAFKYLDKDNTLFFDLIIADFPDPHNSVLAKLYSIEFFTMVKNKLSRGALFVTQSSSPYFSREAFWLINKTLKAVFPQVIPYHVYVPSFGDWGFNIAIPSDINLRTASKSLKFRIDA